MNISLQPGKYVIAVSGGVDSIVLLHILQTIPGLDLVVAHFDHGIRNDSAEDAVFVRALANLYGLEFMSEAARLGPGASEDTARKHRYAFLHKARENAGAQAVVTAHHQDDVIETALLNVMRGTKRRGLVSLQSTDIVKRPLLGVSKEKIRQYAVSHCLEWVEDSTNQEMKYARNRVRALLYKYLTPEKRSQITRLLIEIDNYNSQIDAQVNEILKENKKSLEKQKISPADELTASEIIAAWLRQNGTVFDKKTIERIFTGSKELRNGSKIDIDKHFYCLITKHEIVLTCRESV